MNEFPLRLRSRETGNVYEFDGPSSGTVVSLGFKSSSREVGEYSFNLIHYTNPIWKRVDPEFISYDPTQQGETDDDI